MDVSRQYQVQINVTRDVQGEAYTHTWTTKHSRRELAQQRMERDVAWHKREGHTVNWAKLVGPTKDTDPTEAISRFMGIAWR